MTSSLSTQSTDHLVQICKERSARGVATRADWERLSEINPERAQRELRNYLMLTNAVDPSNPYDRSEKPRFTGMAAGFVIGALLMAGWWYIADYLMREVINSARQEDLLTFSQYVAASLLPFFAWLGWRMDRQRQSFKHEPMQTRESLVDATWEDLLNHFDATRKAGGTRAY